MGCFHQRAQRSLPAAEREHAGARRIRDRSAPVPARAGSESEQGEGGHCDGGGLCRIRRAVLERGGFARPNHGCRAADSIGAHWRPSAAPAGSH